VTINAHKIQKKIELNDNNMTGNSPKKLHTFWQSSSPMDTMRMFIPWLANSCENAFPIPWVLPVTTS